MRKLVDINNMTDLKIIGLQMQPKMSFAKFLTWILDKVRKNEVKIMPDKD